MRSTVGLVSAPNHIRLKRFINKVCRQNQASQLRISFELIRDLLDRVLLVSFFFFGERLLLGQHGHHLGELVCIAIGATSHIKKAFCCVKEC